MSVASQDAMLRAMGDVSRDWEAAGEAVPVPAPVGMGPPTSARLPPDVLAAVGQAPRHLAAVHELPALRRSCRKSRTKRAEKTAADSAGETDALRQAVHATLALRRDAQQPAVRSRAPQHTGDGYRPGSVHQEWHGSSGSRPGVPEVLHSYRAPADRYRRGNAGRDFYSRDGPSRDGHGRDGQNRDAPIRDGHSRDGYSRDGYARDGYGRAPRGPSADRHDRWMPRDH